MEQHTSHCPICGTLIRGSDDLTHAQAWAAHRCSPRTLVAIDGAHRCEVASGQHEWPSVNRRLYDGLAWRIQDEVDWDDPDTFYGRPGF
jgi:hypothetical protein